MLAGGFDHLDRLGEGGFLHRPSDLIDHSSIQEEGAGIDRVARPLEDRNRLPGDVRGVEVARALEDFPIGRHLGSRNQTDTVPGSKQF